MFTRTFISPGLWRATAASATVLLMGATAGFAQGYKPQEFALEPGDAVVTGFSGVVPGAAKALKKAATQDEAEEVFIDLGGASMVIVKAGASGRPPIPAEVTFEVTAGEVGQVFPIALGKRKGAGADIYLGATSLFGLQIVLPDSDGDGRPERTRTGHPNAEWMQGQFGTEDGSGPGSIWKVDGATGEVSLFANLDENSGPGIGDIVRHPRTGQLYASDLDTGLVHRIGDDGRLIDAYDHGMAALGNFGGQPMADDGKVADIKDSGFDSDDPGTCGLTQSARRVWGMAIRGDRLFYSVSDGAEIWSVGLNADGSFSSDIRPEIDIEAGEEPLPITDMVFSADGSLYAAQRGFMTGGFDTSIFADNKDAKVLRFVYDDRAGGAGGSPWRLVQPDVTGDLPKPLLLSGGIDLRSCENYNDGPFDQLPDNFIEGDSLKEAIIAAAPYMEGRIDRLGNAPSGDERFFIGPYITWSEQADLSPFNDCADSKDTPRDTYYACFSMDPGSDFEDAEPQVNVEGGTGKPVEPSQSATAPDKDKTR